MNRQYNGVITWAETLHEAIQLSYFLTQHDPEETRPYKIVTLYTQKVNNGYRALVGVVYNG